MRILLISPLVQACNYIGDYYARWPQLGFAYIAAALEQGGHEVRILERRLLAGPKYPDTRKDFDRINRLMLSQIQEFNPGVIGLTANTPVIMDACRAASIIKSAYPEIPIIAGGRHPTSEPFRTLGQCKDIDIVCRGEGEAAMLELAGGMPWEKIKGLIFRKGNDGFTVNPDRPPIPDLDSLPYPAWHLLDQDFYFHPNISVMRGDYMRTATIMTSRGCPYRCAFCQSPELLDIYGRGYIRYHSCDRVVNEIEYLIDRFKITGLSFNDDMFSLDRERALQICNKIIERGINKQIKFTVNLRSDRVDRELLAALKEANCIHVIFGCESGSEATLKRMNKGTSVKKNIEAIELTKRYGLTAEANIVIGSPGERKSNFLETISFLKKSRPDKIFVSKFYPIPGTRFYADLVARGVISVPQDWDDLNTLYVETDSFTFADMTAGEFVRLRNKANREIVLWTNYMYVIKRNFCKEFKLAASQFIKLAVYTLFYYLPHFMQLRIKKIADKTDSNIRYFFRK